MEWNPHVTVAAIVEQDNRFLMIKEESDGLVVLNQPAGHLEDRESPIEAVIRETYEESGYHFVPESLVGIYQWRMNETEQTYFRFCFAGSISGFDKTAKLDEGIIEAQWLSYDEICNGSIPIRSPMVPVCIDSYLAGTRLPLETLTLVS
jgi:8-oxo-dGTP pyrophosphatase MutT (NUDIX family)